jgi:hypothetical protein
MSAGMPDNHGNLGRGSMTIPIIVVICEILANSYIIWFLLIDFPTRCSHLAAATNGMQTCGMGTSGYIIATLSAIMILGGVYYLTKWSVPQEA